MDDLEFQQYIREALDGHVDLGDAVRRIETFRESGVLTRDAGLVVRMRDGSQFQVTIVRSR